jgi:transposase-like protein
MSLETSGRRTFTAQEKVAIVLEGLRGESQVSELCRRHGITTNQFYQWRDKLIGAAKEAFAQERRGRPKGNRQMERLQADLARKDTVIAEITEEILKVKKGLWPSRITPS